MKRRHFIQHIAAAAVYSQLPLLIKCSVPNKNKVATYIENLPKHSPLSTMQAKNCVIVQQILFPDTENSPGSITLNSFPFFISVLNDAWRDESENEYLIKGLDKLNDFAKGQNGLDFYQQKIDKQQEVLANYIEDKGENWASAMLSIIFESLFSNPIYGCNPDEIGWKWLNYTPGQPQPSEQNKYPELIKKRKSENKIITSLEQILQE